MNLPNRYRLRVPFQYRGGRLPGSPTPPKGETRRASAPRRERGRAASSRVFLRRCVPQKRGTCYTMQAAFTIGYLTQQTRADIPCPDQLQRVLASALLSAPHPLRRIVAPSLSARGVRAKRRWRDGTAAVEPRCAARARRRPRVHVPHAARTEERTRNVSRTDPAVGRAREGSRARRDGMENPFRVYGACGAPKQADSQLVGVVVQLRAPCPHPCKCIRRS